MKHAQNSLALLLILFLSLAITACSTQSAAIGAAQFYKQKRCDPTSEISYMRCDTHIQTEYEKGQALRKRHLEEVANDVEITP